MKKTRKKLVGGLGLALVAGMTFVATQIPSPGASAADVVVNATDVLKVRVVDPVADVKFTEPAENLVTYNPNQTISFDYSMADKVVLKMSYTAKGSDTVQTVTYGEYNADYEAGDVTLNVNLDENYLGVWGYGTFVWTLEGYDYNGVKTNEDEVEIEYQPLIADMEVNEDGSVDFDFSYDPDVVAKTNVSVYKSNANGEKLSSALYSKDYGNNASKATVPNTVFTELGWYRIEMVVTLSNGSTYTMYYLYHVTELPDTGAPDTGRLFQNLNISREDYLVTGLIVFFVFAVVAFGVVARGRRGTKVAVKSSTKSGSKRR